VVAVLLAEIVSRKRGFPGIVREEVFIALDMKDAWLGMPPADLRHQERKPLMP
jgi:hypothetical protein